MKKDIHPEYRPVVFKQMDVWIVSTKNTVSNKKPIKTTSTWQWFFLVLPNTKKTAPSDS